MLLRNFMSGSHSSNSTRQVFDDDEDDASYGKEEDKEGTGILVDDRWVQSEWHSVRALVAIGALEALLLAASVAVVARGILPTKYSNIQYIFRLYTNRCYSFPNSNNLTTVHSVISITALNNTKDLDQIPWAGAGAIWAAIRSLQIVFPSAQRFLHLRFSIGILKLMSSGRDNPHLAIPLQALNLSIVKNPYLNRLLER